MRREHVRKTFFIALSAWLVAAPSFAQTTTPPWDFSAAYSFLRDQDFEENFHGWLISGGANLTPLFSVVGELGGNYKSFDDGPVDVKLSLYSFMGGPRIQARDSATFTPYGQILFGAVRGSVSVEDESDSETDFALQPGAGIDWWFQPNAGLRFGVDYRRIFTEGEGTDQFGIRIGIVLTGGS
jgi:hypothetical protein